MSASGCADCNSSFSALRWKYTCQACGHGPICKKCCSYTIPAFRTVNDKQTPSKPIPIKSCKKCFKKFGDEDSRGKQTDRVIGEIFQTEQNYCKNLRLVDDIYARHFTDAAHATASKSKAKNKSVAPCATTLMFTSWRQLTTLHGDFLDGLSNIVKNKGKGSITPPSSPRTKKTTTNASKAAPSAPPVRTKKMLPSISIHVCLIPNADGKYGCRLAKLGSSASGAIAALAGACGP